MSFTKINYVDNETIITAENLNAIQDEILNVAQSIYPIGSIYMSISDVSPASFIGGTWERITDKFLLGSGSNYTIGTEGGSATHIHTTNDCILTIAQIPSHAHTFHVNIQHSDGTIVASSESLTSGLQVGGRRRYTDTTYSNGSGQAHNHGNTNSSSNMPPYLVVNIWKRVS